MRKSQFSHIYHQGCSTSFMTTLLADPKSVKTFTTNDSRVVPHRSTELAHCRLVSQIGRDATFSARYERMMGTNDSHTPIRPRWEEDAKKKLLVGESNPGRLRDRQKCYQLHQRGSLAECISYLEGRDRSILFLSYLEKEEKSFPSYR